MFYTHFHAFKPCSNSLLCCSNTVQTVCPCLAMFEQCSDMFYTHFHVFELCLNSLFLFGNVRTLFRHCSDMLYIHFHVFEPCLNSPPCSGVLFEQCSNSLVLFGKVRTLRTVFELRAHAHHQKKPVMPYIAICYHRVLYITIGALCCTECNNSIMASKAYPPYL